MARTQGSHSHSTAPRIREAALKLFATHGYAAVSMRQIASEVGVQAGALYRYTPDKQSLLFDLMRTHLEDLLAAHAALPRPCGARDALRAFARFHIRFHAARADAVFIAYMELRNLTPENFAAIGRLRHAYEAEAEKILRAGVAEGVFDIPEPRIAAMAIIAMLTGINTWFRDGGRLRLDQIEQIYGDMVMRSVARG